MGDWSWLWYLSNYWRLNLYLLKISQQAAFTLVELVEATWCRKDVTSLTCQVKKQATSTRDRLPLCLCAALLLSHLWDGSRKHAGMTQRDQGRLVICDKAFIFQLLQGFSESWSQNHGFTSFLLFVQFSSQCNIWSCVCVCCCMCWLAW